VAGGPVERRHPRRPHAPPRQLPSVSGILFDGYAEMTLHVIPDVVGSMSDHSHRFLQLLRLDIELRAPVEAAVVVIGIDVLFVSPGSDHSHRLAS
jgi:hypothetical protein